jgi:hypothetical protein
LHRLTLAHDHPCPITPGLWHTFAAFVVR